MCLSCRTCRNAATRVASSCWELSVVTQKRSQKENGLFHRTQLFVVQAVGFLDCSIHDVVDRHIHLMESFHCVNLCVSARCYPFDQRKRIFRLRKQQHLVHVRVAVADPQNAFIDWRTSVDFSKMSFETSCQPASVHCNKGRTPTFSSRRANQKDCD